MNYHTTTPKTLDTFILSFVLVPKETYANTSKPFLDIFSTMEVQSSRFFRSSSSNQVLISIQLQHQKSKSNTHFLVLQKVQQLSFSSSPKNMPSHSQPASNILLITSSPRFPEIILPISLQNMIHKAHEEFSLSN